MITYYNVKLQVSVLTIIINNIHYILFILFSESHECYYTNDIQLYYDRSAYISFPNGTQFIVAYPQICKDDYNYTAICSSIITDYEADQICMSTGYTTGYAGALYGNSNDYYPLLTKDGTYKYYCPDYADSIYECQFNFTDGLGCTEENGPGLVTCITGECHVLLQSIHHIYMYLYRPRIMY